MTFDVAAQIPVVLVRDPSTDGADCSICERPIMQNHFVWVLQLSEDSVYMAMHKHCARRNGFGTDHDRVFIGEGVQA